MAVERLVGLWVEDPDMYQKYREGMLPILKNYGGGFGYDFQVSEVLKSVLYLRKDKQTFATSMDQSREARSSGSHSPLSILGSVLPLAWKRKFHLLRSSVIGSLAGMLPGAGADIAAWISYASSNSR